MKSILRSLTILVSVAFIWTGVSSDGFCASAEFRRVELTADRQFVVGTNTAALEVSLRNFPIRILVSEQTVTAQGLSLPDLEMELETLLAPRSELWISLDQLFPNSRERVIRMAGGSNSASSALVILLDDFSAKGAGRPPFASYYLREPFRVIGLDTNPYAKSYWLPSLAHELTHALLADQNIESWWEEGLAQMIEMQAGGRQPQMTVRSLEIADHLPLPNLLETARPLRSREQYALSYLFASYVYSSCGGWGALKAMIGSDFAQPIGTNSNFATLTKRLAGWVESETKADPSVATTAFRLPHEKITPNGLLRFFYMSLVLNSPVYPRYQIPQWRERLQIRGESFATLPLRKVDVGQMAVFEINARAETRAAVRSFNDGLSPNVEAYLVQVDANGKFQIFPRERIDFDRINSFLARQFIMIFNPLSSAIAP